MKLAFTLCSNNYLAQAKILGDSFIKNNSGYKFIIGLVDRLNPLIDYKSYIGYELIPVENIGIDNFEEIWKKYNIIELNTCIKPSYFKYLFNRYPDVEFVLFFDPDIQFFSSLLDIETEFDKNDFILIPHVYKPIKLSDQRPNENDFLNYGIYNLGFLGLKNSHQILKEFLPWWEERALNLGYIRTSEGLFVDQIWFNLVPLFFNKISILKHPGCDVAPWNLHERELSVSLDKIMVNSTNELIFYHFSSFKYNNPEIYFYHYNRNTVFINETVTKLYSDYLNLLLQNNVEIYFKIKCHFVELKEKYDMDLFKKQNTIKRRTKKFVKDILPPFLSNLISKLILKVR